MCLLIYQSNRIRVIFSIILGVEIRVIRGIITRVIHGTCGVVTRLTMCAVVVTQTTGLIVSVTVS